VHEKFKTNLAETNRTNGLTSIFSERADELLRHTDRSRSISPRDGPKTSAFFRMRTLYNVQKNTIWRRYDERWALFEHNHLKNEVPIPPSAKFLLIHMAFKLHEQRSQHQLIRRKNQPFKSNAPILDGHIKVEGEQ
jgi:hypothetical protein